MAFSLPGRARVFLFALLLMVVCTVDARAQGPEPITLPYRGIINAIAITTDADGTAMAAWWALAGDGAELLFASAPDWDPVPIARLDQDVSASSSTVAVSPDGAVAWTIPGAEAAILYRRTADGALRALELNHAPGALAFGSSDVAYWAAVVGDELLLGSMEMAEPKVIATVAEIDELTFCVDGSVPYVSFTGRAKPEGPLGLYLVEGWDGVPRQMAIEASEPVLRCGGDGSVHLAWRQEAGLRVVSPLDAEQVIEIATPELSAWDLAVDRLGHACLSWAGGDAIWSSCRGDWSRQHVQHLITEPVQGLAMTLPSSWAVRLLWCEGQSAQVCALRYLEEAQSPGQLRVISSELSPRFSPETRFVAISNLPSGEIASVRFYLVARDGLTAGAWRSIQDVEGGAAPAVRVPAAMVQPGQSYAVVAQALLVDGQSLVAQGDWLKAESGWPAIIARPAIETWRGVIDVRLLPQVERDANEIYELWLQPVTDDLTRQTPVYLGAFVLPVEAASGEWFTWPVDSRTVPDGRYRLYATMTIEDDTFRLLADGEVTIDNACPPSISAVTVTFGGRQRDRLRVAVQAQDVDGSVQRVDMFLVSSGCFAVKDDGGVMLWLGSDNSDTGGWGLDVAISDAWRGCEWAVQAIAYDDRDYPSQPVTSNPFTLPPTDVVVRFLRPAAGRLLSGSQRASLIIDRGIATVDAVTFFLEDEAGVIHAFGEGQLHARLAFYEWNTAEWPSGRYRLLARVATAEGASLWPGPEVEIDDDRPWIELETSAEGSLRGIVQHTVRVQRAPAAMVKAAFSLRDADATISVLGSDTTPEDGLSVRWNADQFLRGDYVLSCTLTDDLGRRSRHEWPISLGAQLSIQGLARGERIHGAKSISWQAEGLPGEAVALLHYSPDAGAHWLEVGQAAIAQGSITVDTARLPDSADARFGLSCELAPGMLISHSPAVVVENQAHRPQVALLAPASGDALPRQALVTWTASSPDGDDVTITIQVRQSNGPWIVVASELENTGRYEWDTQDLPAGSDWELRLVCENTRGMRSQAAATDLVLTGRRAPTVRMVWPDQDVTLDGETAILWSALDLDGDEIVIDLYYSDDAGATWYMLAKGLPNTGYYLWETAFVPPGDRYRLRVVARDGDFSGHAESVGLCRIGTASHSIAILTPEDGRDVRGGVLVCWQSIDGISELASVDAVAVERRTGEEMPIANNAGLVDCAIWDTLYAPDGAYELQVTGHDANQRALTRTLAPVRVRNLTTLPPVGSWMGRLPGAWQGAAVEVLWRAWDPEGDAIQAALQVSYDRGVTWESMGPVDADLGVLTLEMPQTQAVVWARLDLSDARGKRAELGPLCLRRPGRDDVPAITLSLARDGQTDVVRWLAEDPRNRDVTVALSGRRRNGELIHLVDGLDEVGEFAIPANEAVALESICAVADNGVVMRMVCADATSQSGGVTVLEPEAGATVAGLVPIRWELDDELAQLRGQSLQWSQDGRQSWRELSRFSAGERQARWDTVGLEGGAVWLRLELDAEGSSVAYDWGPFWLAESEMPKPWISLVGLPESGTIADATALYWSSFAAMEGARVTLSYRTAPAAPWRILADDQDPTGWHVWEPTTLANGSLIWLRATLEQNGVSAVARQPRRSGG